MRWFYGVYSGVEEKNRGRVKQQIKEDSLGKEEVWLGRTLIWFLELFGKSGDIKLFTREPSWSSETTTFTVTLDPLPL